MTATPHADAAHTAAGTDLRLVPAALAVWLTAVAVLGGLPPRAVWAGTGAAVVAGVLLLRWRFRWSVPAAAVLLCAAAAAAAAGLRLAALHTGPLPALARDRAAVEAEVVVTGDPEQRQAAAGGGGSRSYVVVPARVAAVRTRGRLVHLRSPVVIFATHRGWLSVLPSTRVRVSGRLGPPRVTQPVTAVLSARGPPRMTAGPSWLQRAAERLRAGLRDAVSGLPPAERGLVPGLVLGDTSRMPPDLTDDFRTTGLTHLTAVSGTNITVLLVVSLGLLRWAGVRGRAVPCVAAAVMGAFVVLVRPQPSVLRATAMGLVALLALSSGRQRQGLPALCAAVVALVLVDPWLARSYGFALSVLATGGILVLVPGWRDRIARRAPRPVATAVAVPLAAQAACAPVVVLLSGQVSLVAVPANLLAAPAVPPATVLGVLATCAAPCAQPLAVMLGWLAGLPAWWIVEVAEHGARLPGAAVGWPSSVAGGLALAVVTVVAVPVMRRLARHGRFAVASVLVVLVTAGIRPVLPALPPGWPPSGWLLVACDVGQGDALVLSVAPRTAVVVDTGPDPDVADRCLRDLGIRRIPLVVLTHFHADHVEGLPGVLRGRQVAGVEVTSLDDPPAEADRVRRWAAAAGAPVSTGTVGERRIVGDLSWRVLWPRRLIVGEGSAPNNASLVLQVERAGVRMLLTGDVEPPAQAALLGAEKDLRADLLKVPHHGSLYQDPGLVRAVRPRVAIISVGRRNDYGHPAAATVTLMRSSGARVARTDQDGDVAVVGPADRLRVVTRHRQTLPVLGAGRAVGSAQPPAARPPAVRRASARPPGARPPGAHSCLAQPTDAGRWPGGRSRGGRGRSPPLSAATAGQGGDLRPVARGHG